MPIQSSSSTSQIEQLEVHLRTNRYATAMKRLQSTRLGRSNDQAIYSPAVEAGTGVHEMA